MNGLGLFAGVGGLELGLYLTIPTYSTVCFVEFAEFPQKVLSSRFPETPIWDDVRSFRGTEWRGSIDIITAGFPCQLYSRAARGRNRGEPLWPEVVRLVEEVHPRQVFLENVPAAPWDEVSNGLRNLGYNCASRVFCSSEVGAPTRRRRVFLLATDPHRHGQSVGTLNAQTPRLSQASKDSAKTPRSVRVVNGTTNWVDRFRACGNAVIPEMAALAYTELNVINGG